MNAAPAFQLYAQDFLVGCADLSAEETGAYIRLLCYQWAKGGLPDSDAKLAALAGCRKSAIAAIRSKFAAGDDGLLRNSRLEEVRARQDAFRARQAANASRPRINHGTATAKPRLSDGTAKPEPEHQPDASQTPALHLQSSSSSSKKAEAEGGTPEGRDSALPLSLPACLDTPEFRAKWEEYVAYRREKRLARMVPSSVRKLLAKMAKWGEPAAMAAIDKTIESNWQGVFEPKPEDVKKAAPIHAGPRLREPDNWRELIRVHHADNAMILEVANRSCDWGQLPRHVQETVVTAVRAVPFDQRREA